MDPATALTTFSIAALLMTLTPGLDTALVLRTATVEGPRAALQAGCGIVGGVLLWGLVAALGLGAVVAVSHTAWTLLQWLGAGWLAWLGFSLLRRAWSGGAAPIRPGTRSARIVIPGDAAAETASIVPAAPIAPAAPNWFLRGLLTNALNPKVGAFYISLLPQFMPADVPVLAFSVLLAAIHAVMGLIWFAVLVYATRPLARWLGKPSVVRSLDGLTGIALLAFGLRLAFARPGAG